jgi:glycerol-3-phosphate dehydrogenase
MGQEIAPGLYAAEVDYLMAHEWALGAADILWRRSKLGLHLAPGTEQLLDHWIREQHQNEHPSETPPAGAGQPDRERGHVDAAGAGRR